MTDSREARSALDLSLFGDAHVERYEATDGAEGYIWNGAPTLVLTTTGRKSGQPRKSALIFGKDGDNFLLIASQGGAPKHPMWYLNLRDNPEVELQVLGDKFRAHARTATPDEKPRLWKIMTESWPSYDAYQTRTERDIPLVVLERI
jgi:deazaflavin-dependent oxidoreductase (nitroreductase family)